VFLGASVLHGRRMPANLPVGRDLTIRCKIENRRYCRYYCAFGRSNRSRAAWSGDNSISCGRPSRARRSCAPSRPARGNSFSGPSPGRPRDAAGRSAGLHRRTGRSASVGTRRLPHRPTKRSEHIAEVGMQRCSGGLHCMYACIDESKVRMQALLSCSEITHSNPCPWTEIGPMCFRMEVPKNLYRLGSRRT
jgi:hypothetical protein